MKHLKLQDGKALPLLPTFPTPLLYSSCWGVGPRDSPCVRVLGHACIFRTNPEAMHHGQTLYDQARARGGQQGPARGRLVRVEAILPRSNQLRRTGLRRKGVISTQGQVPDR